MNERAQIQTKPDTPSFSPHPALTTGTRLLQRTCACGGTPGFDGECAECRRTRLQRGPSNQETPENAQPAEGGVSGVPNPRFGHAFSRISIQAPSTGAIRAEQAAGDGACTRTAYRFHQAYVQRWRPALARRWTTSGCTTGRPLIARPARSARGRIRPVATLCSADKSLWPRSTIRAANCWPTS